MAHLSAEEPVTIAHTIPWPGGQTCLPRHGEPNRQHSRDLDEEALEDCRGRTVTLSVLRFNWPRVPARCAACRTVNGVEVEDSAQCGGT